MSSFHVVLSPFNIALFWLFFFSGYLYAHISYLEDNCPACLLLLSTDRNAFFELAGSRKKTLEVSTVFVVWKLEKDDYTTLAWCSTRLREEPRPFPIRHSRNCKGTRAELLPAIVSGIVTGDAQVSYWSIFSLPGNIPRSLFESELDPVSPFLQLWIFWERVLWFFSVWRDTGV